MSVALSEHLPLLATAPDGIQKLRGLILELAVRGKLVPQDPNDEPASELLKRIAAERTRLEAAGICKKSKATPLDVDDAPPFKLPAGWVLSQLSDLTLVLNGRAYSKDELLSEGVPVLRVGNLFTSNHWYYSNLRLEEDKYCDQGDLLYSWSASFGPFIWQGPKVIYHYHIWKLRLFDESSLSKEFFYKFLLEKTAEIKAAGHGVSMIHMTKEKMEKILVPVPPLAEQHRIVAKVDELMALCDQLEAEQTDAEAAHARLVATLLDTLTQSTDAANLAANWQRLAEHFGTLFTTESSLDALKQTILQLAVMGKLVPQNPNDEPASELLRRITPQGTNSGTSLDEKESRPPGAMAIPSNWRWSSVEQLTKPGETTTYGILKPVWVKGGVPTVRVSEIKRGRIDIENLPTCDPERASRFEKTKLQAHDLLISKDGTIGKTAFVPPELSGGNITQHMLRFPITDQVDRNYVRVTIDAPFCQAWMLGETKGVALKGVNVGDFRRMPIPLPPVAEQHRIVAKVDELMALCDRLKAGLAESRTQQERLATTLIESALKVA